MGEGCEYSIHALFPRRLYHSDPDKSRRVSIVTILGLSFTAMELGIAKRTENGLALGMTRWQMWVERLRDVVILLGDM